MSGGADGTIYDQGTVSISVNGHSDTTGYGEGSTASSIASGLVTKINGDSAASVTASLSGSTVELTSKTTGSSTNWPISTSITYDSTDFTSSSFAAGASGMSGGQGGTLYDTGKVTITVNGHGDSASYGSGSTSSTIAEALVSAINGDSGASVTAGLSGSTVNLTSKTAGSNTNYSLSTSVTYNTQFSQSSFTATPSGATLTGGTSIVYDSGTVTLTINGTPETASYGENDTTSTVASNLAGAFSGDSEVKVTASGSTINIVSTTSGASTNYSFSSSETHSSSFSSPSFTVSPSSGALTGGTTNGVPTAAILYDFSVPSNGYAPNGDLLQVDDSVTGNWTYTYDSLNRLSTAAAAASPAQGYFAGLDLAWTYDKFGNRESQTASGTSSVSITQPEPLSFTSDNNRANQFTYNADGDVLTDFANNYLYDAEGRVCAVDSPSGGVVLYLYDAAGNRVAKGSGSYSCDMTTNGFTITHWYILDLAGRQMTEYNGSTWAHTNVFANGELLATYSSSGTPMTFALNDWLGTKRVQAKADAELDISFPSLPYGDQLPNGTGATQQFFTGKQRDPHSGNDYFGARYYSSEFGRWLSPDWSAKVEPVPYAKLADPQSLNLYDYIGDNPTSGVDVDGHAPGGTTGAEDCANGAVTECAPQTSQPPSQAPQKNPTTTAPQKNIPTATAHQQTEPLTVNKKFHFSVTTWSTTDEAGMKGMTIEAIPSNCANCKWIQTVNVNGKAKTDYSFGVASSVDPAPIFGNNTDVPNGQYILFDSPNVYPSQMSGYKYMVSTFGTRVGNTFNVYGSITWGFSVSGPNVNVMVPRQSSAAEQRGSLSIIHSQYPDLHINLP